MREENQVRLPDRQRFDNPPVIKEGLLSKIMMGLLCSAIVAIIMNFAGLKWLVLFIFASVINIFGGDAKLPDTDQKPGVKLYHDLEKKAKEAAAPGIVTSTLPLAAKGVGNRLEAKVDAKVDEAKADVIDALAEKSRLKAERDEAARERKEAAEREKLIVEARTLGLPFDEDWSTDKLRAEVHAKVLERRRDADWRAYEKALADWRWNRLHGPNARCPTCKHPTRISDARLKVTLKCSRCGAMYGGSRGRAAWVAPKEPQPPAERKGFLGGLFQ